VRAINKRRYAMVKLKKAVSAGVLSLGLVVGLAGFAGAASGTIGTTGPDSQNEISNESHTKLDVDNKNDLNFANKNHQYASSGSVEVKDNTTGGGATSGDGMNDNSLNAEVEFDNSQSAGAFDGVGSGGGASTGSIDGLTGPDSHNTVKSENKVEIDVNNDNKIHVYNNNDQVAKSGDAEVRHNTTGGDATSGSVTNTSSSTFTVRVTN